MRQNDRNSQCNGARDDRPLRSRAGARSQRAARRGSRRTAGSAGRRSACSCANSTAPTARSTKRCWSSRASIRRRIFPGRADRRCTASTSSARSRPTSRSRSKRISSVYAPGAYGQKHGHLNSAVFYVLKGRGHDIHDGRRIDWKAGDVMIVEYGCVHQHFNDDPDNEAHPPGVQGQAAVPVHAPVVPEDRLLSADRARARARGLPAAEGFVMVRPRYVSSSPGRAEGARPGIPID